MGDEGGSTVNCKRKIGVESIVITGKGGRSREGTLEGRNNGVKWVLIRGEEGRRAF